MELQLILIFSRKVIGMNKFLDNLSDLVYKCYDGVASDAPLPDVECTYDRLELIREKLESLGDNARRMLEIGVVQDELVKLGFVNFRPYISCFIFPEIMVDFDINKVILVHQNIIFNYTSPTWQEDLINRVKELIK